MSSIEQLSYQDKINMIRSRYKSTKDLWIYLVERRELIFLLRLKFVLPSWLLDAFFEELSVIAHPRYLDKKKEGPASQRRECEENSIMALIKRQELLSVSSLKLSNGTRLLTRPPW